MRTNMKNSDETRSRIYQAVMTTLQDMVDAGTTDPKILEEFHAIFEGSPKKVTEENE